VKGGYPQDFVAMIFHTLTGTHHPLLYRRGVTWVAH
jgi:hypothetical protein